MNHKRLNTILIALLGLTLIVPYTAHAGFGAEIMSVLGEGVSFVVLLINYLIGFLGGALFSLSGLLLQMGLELNGRLILSPIVRVGWTIMRDLANMGFVIAIIVVAFSIMLRFESYTSKKVLQNLIIMALLVNFSLTIAGFFIDASGVASNFFLNKISPNNYQGVVENIASAFQIQKLQQVPKIEELPDFSGVQEFNAAIVGLIASMFFIAVFTVLSSAVMLLLAILVMLRYIILLMLVIIMPMVWVFYIFPYFKDWWDMWWSHFIRWIIFLPLSLFWIFLSVLMVTNFADDPHSVIKISQSVGADSGFLGAFLFAIKDVFDVAGQMIIILGLMVAGMISTHVVSKVGAKGIIQSAEKWRGWALGGIGAVATSPYTLGKRVVRGSEEQASGEFTEQLRNVGRSIRQSKLYGDIAKSRLLQTPGLRGLVGVPLEKSISADRARSKDEVETYKKEYLDPLVSDEQIMASREFATPVGRAAKFKKLVEKKLLKQYLENIENTSGKDARDAQLHRFVEAARLTSISKDVEKSALETQVGLAEFFGKSVEEVVNSMSPQKIVAIDMSSWNDENIAKKIIQGLKMNGLNELSKVASPELKKIIEDAVQKTMTELRQKAQLDASQENSLQNLIAGGIKKKRKDIGQLLQSTKLDPHDQEIFINILQKDEYINNNLGW